MKKIPQHRSADYSDFGLRVRRIGANYAQEKYIFDKFALYASALRIDEDFTPYHQASQSLLP